MSETRKRDSAEPNTPSRRRNEVGSTSPIGYENFPREFV